MPIKKKIKSIIQNSKILSMFDRTITFYCNKLIYSISPKKAANIAYKHFFGHDIDWKNPKDLIEKIFWLQFNTDTTLWSRCADKYAVREYIESQGLGKYLVKCYGHWNNANDIDFDKLPSRFVLKTNNACETVIIVKDKSKLDLTKVRKQLNNWLKRPYGYYAAQKHYLKIHPCILAEEYLEQSDEEKALSPNSLIDYKIWCFNGKVEYVWIGYDRTPKNVKMSFVNNQWQSVPNALSSNSHYINNGGVFKKPTCWNEMVYIAEKLAKPFPEIRIDLYVINNHPYFGEMTFTSGFGYFTHQFYKELGDKVTLPK